VTAVFLARHGETDDNAPPQRVMGWLDSPLNERGREQARALAAEAAGHGFASLYASHLARARQTAEIVGEALGLEPVVDERLAESRRGAWEGRLVDEIRRDEPDAWAAWIEAREDFEFPGGGEALAAHCARVAEALGEVGAGPLPALVVCHGGSIRCAFAARDPRGLAAFHELDVPNATLMRLPA
jgi:broad specificity phosphatase PhoE